MREIMLSLLSQNNKLDCIECEEVNWTLSYSGIAMWDSEEDRVYEYRVLHTDSEIIPIGIVERNVKMLFGGVSNQTTFTGEMNLTDKLKRNLTVYGDLEEWRQKKRPHPTKEAIIEVIRGLISSWTSNITQLGKLGDFDIVLVSGLDDAVIVTFRYKGKVQEPIKFYLLRRTAVRLRNYGSDTEVFKHLVESICPVLWY